MLLPLFHKLWLAQGTGNTNIFYASTLVFACANGATLVDCIWAGLRIAIGEEVGGYNVTQEKRAVPINNTGQASSISSLQFRSFIIGYTINTARFRALLCRRDVDDSPVSECTTVRAELVASSSSWGVRELASQLKLEFAIARLPRDGVI